MLGGGCFLFSHAIGNPPFTHAEEDSISYHARDIDNPIKPLTVFSEKITSYENDKFAFNKDEMFDPARL